MNTRVAAIGRTAVKNSMAGICKPVSKWGCRGFELLIYKQTALTLCRHAERSTKPVTTPIVIKSPSYSPKLANEIDSTFEGLIRDSLILVEAG